MRDGGKGETLVNKRTVRSQKKGLRRRRRWRKKTARKKRRRKGKCDK